MPSPEDIAVAKRSILFSSMPAETGAELLSRSVVRGFPRGASIFLQGEPAEHVYVVLAGWVKLFRVTSTGGEAVVGVFTRGESIGEAVAFRSDTYPVNGEAVTDCRLMQVRAGLVLERMRREPEVAQAILAATFLHLHELVQQVEQLKAQTGAQRVAEFLLDLCPAEEGSCTVTLPYDKVLIAGRLGIKPESLSRAFARLREAGVTVRQNHAAVADVERLRAFVEQDRADFWRKAE